MSQVKVIVAGCTELGNHIARGVLNDSKADLMGMVWSPETAGARKAGWCHPDPVIVSRITEKRLVYADPITYDAVRTVSEGYVESIIANVSDRIGSDAHRPDILIQCWRSDIFPKDVLDFPRYCLGIHPTPLRFGIGRGAAALNHTLIEMYDVEADELPFWENAIFIMEPKPDTGKIVETREFKITYLDNMTTLLHKVAYTSRLMFKNIINRVYYNTFDEHFIEAPTGKIMSYPHRTPLDSAFNFKHKAMHIIGLVKASTHPYSGAFFNSQIRLDSNLVYVWDAYAKERIRGGQYSSGGQSGKVVAISPEGIEVTTGDLSLNIVITSIGIDDAIFIPYELAQIVNLCVGDNMAYMQTNIWE